MCLSPVFMLLFLLDAIRLQAFSVLDTFEKKTWKNCLFIFAMLSVRLSTRNNLKPAVCILMNIFIGNFV
jgi:hypothetical protein